MIMHCPKQDRTEELLDLINMKSHSILKQKKFKIRQRNYADIDRNCALFPKKRS